MGYMKRNGAIESPISKEVFDNSFYQGKGWEYVDEDYVEPVPEPVIVIPTIITMRQARIILLRYNMLDAVDLGIKNSRNKELQIYWEYGSEVDRSHSEFASMLLLFPDLTNDVVLQMFQQASLL